MIATLLTSVCLSLSPAMLVEPPEELEVVASIPAEAFPVIESEEDALVWVGWRCREFSSCPQGVLLLEPDGNHVGCTAVVSPVPACTGDCYTCDGVEAATRLCQAVPWGQCKYPPSTQLVTCGTARKHPNACTHVQSSGTPTTPNGCYCNTTIGIVYEWYQCEIASCMLPVTP